jgi:hypothetical protein
MTQERDEFRKTKGVVTRDDINYLLETMSAVKLSVDTLTAAVSDGMQKICQSADVARNTAGDNPHPPDNAADIAADAAGEPKEYICFNCGNVHDKPVQFCVSCHTGLKWK